jgi:hypothetical protein
MFTRKLNFLSIPKNYDLCDFVMIELNTLIFLFQSGQKKIWRTFILTKVEDNIIRSWQYIRKILHLCYIESF